jgi:hypothetical protein
MPARRSADRLYAAVTVAFLIALVALGLLGVPAPLVAAIGATVATIGIALLHRRRSGPAPARYVPSVLEPSTIRRRRGFHLRPHRHA